VLLGIPRMPDARAQAQRAADAGALAAAVFLSNTVQTRFAAEARAQAEEYARLNPIHGRTVAPGATLTEVLAEEGIVRFRVTGHAIPLWFARVAGRTEATVQARAVAQAVQSGTAECIKPLMIPDWWVDNQPANNRFDAGEFYDPLVTGFGMPYRDPGQPGYPLVRTEGDFWRDFGRPVLLKTGSPSRAMEPGWFFPIRLPGASGGSDYRVALGGDRESRSSRSKATPSPTSQSSRSGRHRCARGTDAPAARETLPRPGDAASEDPEVRASSWRSSWPTSRSRGRFSSCAAGPVLEPALLMQAMRAGITEYLPKPGHPRGALAGGAGPDAAQAGRGGAADAGERQPGKVISFFSAKGGSGATTVATNLAIHLQQLTGKKVLLVDLDLELGEIALFLGCSRASTWWTWSGTSTAWTPSCWPATSSSTRAGCTCSARRTTRRRWRR
jgi:hypothetical protein